MKITKLFFIMALLFGSASCSRDKYSNETFSYPDWKENDRPEYAFKKLVFASTNSFLGKNEGVTELVAKSRVLRIGGFETLQFYVNTLREKYSSELILLDGGYLLGKEDKEKTLENYKSLGHDAILYTENELSDFDITNSISLPFVASNIMDIATGKNKEGANLAPYRVIEKNGIRIGIIGTTTFKKGIQFNGIYFEDPVLSFLKAKKELKEQKVDITVLLVHSQTECSPLPSDEEHHIAGVIECADSSADLEKIISRLPTGSVDLIIGGDAFNLNQNISGIPVLQNQGQGMYISLAKVYVDAVSKKIVPEKTKILNPVKTCSQFFAKTSDCHISHDASRLHKINAIKEDKFKMKLAKFLGKRIPL